MKTKEGIAPSDVLLDRIDLPELGGYAIRDEHGRDVIGVSVARAIMTVRGLGRITPQSAKALAHELLEAAAIIEGREPDLTEPDPQTDEEHFNTPVPLV